MEQATATAKTHILPQDIASHWIRRRGLTQPSSTCRSPGTTSLLLSCWYCFQLPTGFPPLHRCCPCPHLTDSRHIKQVSLKKWLYAYKRGTSFGTRTMGWLLSHSREISSSSSPLPRFRPTILPPLLKDQLGLALQQEPVQGSSLLTTSPLFNSTDCSKWLIMKNLHQRQ